MGVVSNSMGLCSSNEREAQAPKHIRITGYDLNAGDHGAVKEKVKELCAKPGFGEGASLTVVAVDDVGNKLCFVSVFNTAEEMKAYLDKHGKSSAVPTDEIKQYLKSEAATVDESGQQFFKNFKPCKVDEFIRVSVYKATVEEMKPMLTFADKPPAGQIGCAFGESSAGHVFGYQMYDTKASMHTEAENVKTKMASAGHSGDVLTSSEGQIVYANCKAALFDAIPGGADVRGAVGGVLDHTEYAFSHLPMGNYLVDGVTYSVDTVQGGAETLVTTSKEGVTTTYKFGSDGMKVVPGVSHVVEGAEAGVQMGVDGVNTVHEHTANAANTAIDGAKSGTTMVTDTAHSAASATPGVSHAMDAGNATVAATKDVANTASEHTKNASGAVTSTATGERTCW